MDYWAPPLVLLIGAVAGLFVPAVAALFPICVGLAAGIVIGRKTKLIGWLK